MIHRYDTDPSYFSSRDPNRVLPALVRLELAALKMLLMMLHS